MMYFRDYIKNNIEDLTKGEVVLNISGDNSTMLFFDENENLAIFESSVLVDKKIEKLLRKLILVKTRKCWMA